VALYKLFASEADLRRMEDDFRAGGIGYGEFKKRLFEAVWAYFAPMRARREELARDPGEVDRVLKEGAQRAEAVAIITMQRIRQAIGLR
jgi:tryptophanyl-tRNA synthetase